MPQYLKSLKENTPAVQWSSLCFKSNKASISRAITTDGKQQVVVDVTSTLPTAFKQGCSEEYLLLSTFVMKTIHINSAGIEPSVSNQYVIDIPTDVTDAELWDLDSKGIRLLKFVDDFTTSLSNIIKTVDLFLPEFTKGTYMCAYAVYICMYIYMWICMSCI